MELRAFEHLMAITVEDAQRLLFFAKIIGASLQKETATNLIHKFSEFPLYHKFTTLNLNIDEDIWEPQFADFSTANRQFLDDLVNSDTDSEEHARLLPVPPKALYILYINLKAFKIPSYLSEGLHNLQQFCGTGIRKLRIDEPLWLNPIMPKYFPNVEKLFVSPDETKLYGIGDEVVAFKELLEMKKIQQLSLPWLTAASAGTLVSTDFLGRSIDFWIRNGLERLQTVTFIGIDSIYAQDMDDITCTVIKNGENWALSWGEVASTKICPVS
ncbi:hypothetical protein TWF694_005077 [Orbilia ellipsospora]|uniref:Uncharacterized protein n=1 Tax=Orbilia ellipsospora TaxID=2528407 RepID=A0AAV9WVI4_9PEZI